MTQPQPIRVAVARDREAWNSYVAAAGGSVLQSWQWAEFKRRQGWRVVRLVALRDGSPVAAIQVLVRSAPFLGAFFYAAEGPVLAPDAWRGDPAGLAALLKEVRRRGRVAGALVLRVDPLIDAGGAPARLAGLGFERSPSDVQPAATAVVDLDKTEEQLWRALARDARYRIGRARREGVVLRPGTDADVDAFADMLADTGKRKGFGVRGASYVYDLTAMLRDRDSGAFLIAMQGDEAVGATIVTTFGQRAASLYTASNAQGRTVGAQHVLHWEAMLEAKRAGCAMYDFRGVATTGDASGHWSGLTFFKQRFGTRHEDLAGAWDDVYRPLAFRAFLQAQSARRDLPRLLQRLRARNTPETTPPASDASTQDSPVPASSDST